MESCAVYGCNNNSLNTDASVQYYYFPKHPVVCQQWINCCGWQDPNQIDTNTSRICSEHFDEDAYNTEIKMVNFAACYTKILKLDAVPTLDLPTVTAQIIIKESMEQGEVKEMIVYSIETTPVLQQPTTSVDDNKYKHIKTREDLVAIQDENSVLRKKIQTLEGSIRQLKVMCYKNRRELKGLERTYKKVHQQSLNLNCTVLSDELEQGLLAKVFSPSQIKILSGRKKIYWTNDDMAVGYTIRHMSSKRLYLHLTKALNIPLPAISSIKRWATLKRMAVKGGKDDEENKESD